VPTEDGQFHGKIGRDYTDSEPWWPEPLRAPEGAPNVVLIVLDDVGFAQLGCFGSDIDTPTIDRLAADGLRYTGFHTTALCSPTRSCLMTGRNHHTNGMARVTDLSRGFPGYDARIPRSSGFVSEILRDEGYATMAIGKWHMTPHEDWHLGASRRRWPLGRGFERFYGYFGGETHQFSPALVHDNHFTEAPGGYEDGYHLTEDLADHAIEWLNDLRGVDPTKPFFLYFATGACHSPHHAPPEWIEKYQGHFDQGWDRWREETFARQLELGIVPEGTVLSPRPDWVPAWDSLDDDVKRLNARFMECFAAFLSHADAQIGRVIAHLEALGELESTVIVLVSDNGASSEGGQQGSINDARMWNMDPAQNDEMVERIDEIGGPNLHNNYSWGWTMAGCTPLRRWKREVHEGGVADPCIVHYPAGIRTPGELRRQFVHAIDIAPTILDLVGVTAPDVIDGTAQTPMAGASFAPTFADERAATRDTQYFEMLGSRAIYHDGWKAVTFKPLGPLYSPDDDADAPFDDDVWELYHVASDFSECNDLADSEPAKLKELIDLWWREAERFNVLPLDNKPFLSIIDPAPSGIPHRTTFEYRRGSGRIPEEQAADVQGRAHEMTAYVEIPEGGADGVLLAHGSVLGGYTLFVQDGRLQYVHNYVGKREDHLAATDPLTPGAHELRFVYEGEGIFRGGSARLEVDGEVVATGEIERYTPMRFSATDAGLTCGEDAGTASVSRRYRGPFPFTGTLHKVVVEVTGPKPFDPDQVVRAALNRD
jgi:arylsulfatase